MRASREAAALLEDVTSMLDEPSRREMAIPSYTHRNPFVRRLFWQRLDAAVQLAEAPAGASIFEFGVGSGPLLPTHHRRASRVACTDLDLRPARALAHHLRLSPEFIEADSWREWALAEAGRFDVVYALDSLEHLGDNEVAATLPLLVSLLCPNGRLIVSGPTETLAYRLGRRIAGFRNEYHRRDIFDIDRALCALSVRDGWLRVPRPPLPVAFRIGRYVPRAGGATR